MLGMRFQHMNSDAPKHSVDSSYTEDRIPRVLAIKALLEKTKEKLPIKDRLSSWMCLLWDQPGSPSASTEIEFPSLSQSFILLSNFLFICSNKS